MPERGFYFRFTNCKHDSFDARMNFKLLPDRPNGDVRGPLNGKPICPATNRGKCQGFEPMLGSQLHAGSISRCEEFILTAQATLPDRTHGMDDMPRLQAKTWSYLCRSNRTRTHLATCSDELGTCRPMDRPIHATTTRRKPGTDNPNTRALG